MFQRKRTRNLQLCQGQWNGKPELGLWDQERGFAAPEQLWSAHQAKPADEW